MVTAYESVQDGSIRAVLPVHCPFGGDARPCRVGRHCCRERQRGPDFPLVVAICHAHGRYFTLYPPGWTPWGRVPVHEGGDDGDDGDDGAAAWRRTMFVAALDAAEGRLWPVESVGAIGCGRTQSRWLQRCGAWLGIGSDVCAAERAAGVLGLPLAAVVEARIAFLAVPDRRSRGKSVRELLGLRSWGAGDLKALLVVGGRDGVCGRAWRAGPDGLRRIRLSTR